MSKVRIITDPHLGLSRQSHTTRESSARLKQELYLQALRVIDDSPYCVINCGDLFDKASNNEATLLQGYNVARRCRMTLSGNHDELNREGVVTSLAALKEMGVAVCAAPDLSTAYFEVVDEAMYMVPHHASQELFMEACLLAANHASYNREGQTSFLFLHCNYDFSLAVEDNTLNLPSDMAKDLLAAFDYIFIGHEHKPAAYHGGRVVILGNTHPTSFSDISDKFQYTLDLETAELTRELIWSMSNHYVEIPLNSEIPPMDGIEFVEVTGVESVANAVEVSQFIQQIWKAAEYQACGAPGEELKTESALLAVRNKVEIRDSLADVDTDVEPVVLEDLKDRIKTDLAGSDLADLFAELLAEATA